jgi:hypothetical protein
MRRTNWKTVSTLITMAMVAGCSESTVAPAVRSTTVAMALAPSALPSLSLGDNGRENEESSITVGPKGGIFLVGNVAVVFPKGSICDPATSGYDMSLWGAPCEPLRGNITIPYTTSLTNGRTSVDFKTPLRFVPSNDPAQWVWIFMSTPRAASTSLAASTIFYAPVLNGPSYDESLLNPTLRTYVDSRTGVSARRIEHFSGYTSYGRTCDPSTDPNCTAAPGSATPPPSTTP